jgi:hypothetical protein
MGTSALAASALLLLIWDLARDTGGGPLILRGGTLSCRARSNEQAAMLEMCSDAVQLSGFQFTYDPLRQTGTRGILKFWARLALAVAAG